MTAASPIRIAYAALGAGSTPVWMAHEAGLFAAEGLDTMVRGHVRGVHRFKTQPDEAIEIYRKYSLIEDAEVARQCWATMDWYFMAAPYPTVKGMQAVIDQLAGRFPEAARMSAEGMMDLRWVRELEEGGFIQGLYA